MSLEVIEKVIALIGALIVGGFAFVALRGEWHKTGLDDHVTKLLLGLMAFGCVLVLLAVFGRLTARSNRADARPDRPARRPGFVRHPCRSLIYAGIAGIVLIFLVSGMVLSQSGFGHVWPAEDTVNIKL